MNLPGKAPVLLMTYRKASVLPLLERLLAQYAPPRLYIAHNPAAAYDCPATVDHVRQLVSGWSFGFPVEQLFHPVHLPINDSFHRALDYVAGREQSFIVLEDDTVPSPSFFTWCNAMLQRFADDDAIGTVLGCNLGAAACAGAAFRVPFAVFRWGWATWSGRWQRARATAIPWGDPGGVLSQLAGSQDFLGPFLRGLDDASVTWDVRCGWAACLNGQAALVPGVNLVANHGFVPGASFTGMAGSAYARLEAGSMDGPVAPPAYDTAFSREYERRTAALIREILAHKGVLQRYGLD